MTILEEFPEDFWKPEETTAKQVLDQLITETFQRAGIIKGFSEFLLSDDLQEKQRADIEAILVNINDLISILAAARQYIISIDKISDPSK